MIRSFYYRTGLETQGSCYYPRKWKQLSFHKTTVGDFGAIISTVPSSAGELKQEYNEKIFVMK